MKHSCIITGATGYIGSHLVKYLLEQGWEVRIISQPEFGYANICLLYTYPSPRDRSLSRMPSSA